jgi:hypothetical protein
MEALFSTSAGSGYVIRGDTGVFIEAGCCKHQQVEDPFISELLASHEGIEAAVRRGLSKDNSDRLLFPCETMARGGTRAR